MRPDRGFSLLEFVLGITILAIVLLGSTLFFANQPRGLDIVFQYRAVALVEALVEQVLAVRYDEQNNPYTQLRCGIEAGSPPCSSTLGAESGEAALEQFNDVDDFHAWCESPVSGAELAAGLGLANSVLYQRFDIQACVSYGENDADSHFKVVDITIASQGDASLDFTLHRYNLR
ncbi:type IV pilus modification PilV family protein [Zobellella sp. An-6]|uniref:type IV pilus modification PilV family protein n=1 Tax=Zobellella sp. An-6 TaxID=3400218 RepID=UPI00404282D9